MNYIDGDHDEFSWFLEAQPNLGTHMYLWQKQENLKVIEERRAAGMNDKDLRELLMTQAKHRIERNDADRDFWLRDLGRSHHWSWELRDAITLHFSKLKDAIIMAFKEVLPPK